MSEKADITGCEEGECEESEGGRDANVAQQSNELKRALIRIAQQDKLISELQERVNGWEKGFGCHDIVTKLLGLMLKYYKEMKANGAVNTNVSLANRYYIEMNDPTTGRKNVVSIPKTSERLIESLWLGTIKKATITVLEKDCKIELHKHQVLDDKPLPILIFSDDPAHPFAIKRQSDNWRHSFMCKNVPGYPGKVVDSQHVSEWRSYGNFATAHHTLVFPGDELLEEIVALWIGRAVRVPSDATLLVDCKLVRSFVTKIALHDRPRCHFICIGSNKVYGYLVLTLADGMQSEVARLPVGSASF